MVDRCVICGEIIPEGRQVCPMCESRRDADELDRVDMRHIRMPGRRGRRFRLRHADGVMDQGSEGTE